MDLLGPGLGYTRLIGNLISVISKSIFFLLSFICLDPLILFTDSSLLGLSSGLGLLYELGLNIFSFFSSILLLVKKF